MDFHLNMALKNRILSQVINFAEVNKRHANVESFEQEFNTVRLVLKKTLHILWTLSLISVAA